MSTSDVTRLRILSGLATKPALLGSILPGFTTDTGVPVDTVFEPTSVLIELITGGEAFDVVLGVTTSVRNLAANGYVAADSIRHVARSGVGIAAAKAGEMEAPATVDDLIRILCSARSVAYSRSGASGIYFAGLLDRLGIRDVIDAKATVLESGLTATALVDGRADVAIQQVSELLSVPGAVIVGTLPDDVQLFTEFSAGVSAASAFPSAAEELIRALVSGDASAAYVNTGLLRL